MSSPTTPKYWQREEFEYKEFISTLPMAKTFTKLPIYQYQGFWYYDAFVQGLISFQKHFNVEDSDVFLVTNPKGGTTWLKAIMFTLLNRKKFTVDSQNHPLLTTGPHDLVPFLEIHLYAQTPTRDIASFPSPRLFATHVPYVSLPDQIKNNSKCKLVYLCRNPKDILVSFWHFGLKVGLIDMETCSNINEACEFFCKGLIPHGPFWEHVLGYWKQSVKNSDKVLFLKYEDMKAQPAVELRRMAEFLGCPFEAEEEESGLVDQILKFCSFDNLSGMEVNKTGKTIKGMENNFFFRKGEVGDWKNHLSAEMGEKIDRITHEKFSGLGLML